MCAMRAEPDQHPPRTAAEMRAEELERAGAPEWGEGNEPTMFDFLRAAARAVKYLKQLEP